MSTFADGLAARSQRLFSHSRQGCRQADPVIAGSQNVQRHQLDATARIDNASAAHTYHPSLVRVVANDPFWRLSAQRLRSVPRPLLAVQPTERSKPGECQARLSFFTFGT